MHFTIDPAFLTDQTIIKEWGMYDSIPADQLTDEQLLKILKGADRCSSTHSEDHPEFAKLRNELEQTGYIKVQRGWWNGDEVLTPFILNGEEFKVGEQFSCAAALGIYFSVAAKLNKLDKKSKQ